MWSSYHQEKAMNFKAILLVFLFLTSCATADLDSFKEDGRKVDPVFSPYVNQFIDDSRGLVDHEDFENVYIEFADLEGTTAGTCTPIAFDDNLNMYRIIRIDKGWWLYESDIRRKEQLMYHEFGHCILYRDHTFPTGTNNLIGWLERFSFRLGVLRTFDLLPDGCPSSYMNPVLIDKQCIYKHYDYYIDELFGLTEIEEYKEEQIKTTIHEN